MVDDESKAERRPAKHMQTPREWDLKHNPAYNYYCFYIYANLYTLNKLREARGLNTFSFRPHAGDLLSYSLQTLLSLSACKVVPDLDIGWTDLHQEVQFWKSSLEGMVLV